MRRFLLAPLLVLLFLSAAPSYAANIGFYAGAAGGWGVFSANSSYNVDNPLASFQLLDNTLDSPDFFTQLRLGYANGLAYRSSYDHLWQRFHWAVEAYVEPMSHTVFGNNPETDATVSYTMRYNYGFVVKPGIQTSHNTILQAHLGGITAQFSSINTNTGDAASDALGHYSATTSGFRFGLGFEARLTRHATVELAVFRTIFPAKHLQRPLSPPVTETVNGVTGSFIQEDLRFTPEMDQIMINFSYYIVH